MRGLTLVFILLTTSCSLTAQPWQWELYDGDFYNPSGFPEIHMGGWYSEYGPETTGNFEGFGADEFIHVDNALFCLGLHLEGQGYHWLTLPVEQDLVAGDLATGVTSANLDDDPSEELIVFSDTISCWKAISTSPWTWERHDELLMQLYLPDSIRAAIIGDYDGDGLLNELVDVRDVFDGLQMWERNAVGIWERAGGWYNYGSGGFYDGDFDHDGDTDFAVVEYLLYSSLDETASIFYENTGNGIEEVWAEDLPGPMGGDLDGDGQWEALGLWGDSGGFLQEVEPDSNFIHVIGSVPISCLDGQILGNLNTPEGSRVVGAQNIHVSFDLCYWCSRFITRYHTDDQWTFWESGFTRMSPMASFYNIASSLADLDGDGLHDIFQQQTAWSEEVWWVWRNNGSANLDVFGEAYEIHRFVDNMDTSFSSPQIGDITGDGRAELAMIVGVGAQPPRVMFFEMVGEIDDTTFVLHPEWNDGLNAVFDKIRLADIDNDGLAEVMGYDGDTWHSYFRRHGGWIEYSILPPFTGEDIAFADADSDGDLDLFNYANVWLSLSPDKADDPLVPHPSSFTLSAYPNPFNASTTLSFTLPVSDNVTLKLCDLLGREVDVIMAGRLGAGQHRIFWPAGDLASGIYFARLETSTAIATSKLVILK